MDNRILIAVILSLVAVFAYQKLVLERLYPPPGSQSSHQSKVVKNTTPASQPSVAVSAPEGSESVGGAAVRISPEAAAAAREIVVNTDLYKAVFTTEGARLKSFELNKFRETTAPSSPPVDMVHRAPDGELPLGMLLKSGDQISDDGNIAYQTTAAAEVNPQVGEPATIKFVGHTQSGAEVTKTVTMKDGSYAFELSAEVRGQGVEVTGFDNAQTMAAGKGYYNVTQLQARVAKKLINDQEKQLKKNPAPANGEISYAGFGNNYFLSVYIPASGSQGSLLAGFGDEQGRLELRLAPAPRLATEVYIGPKLIDAIDEVDPQLSSTIYYGWTGPLQLAFLRVLKLFHHVTGNYGVDIILLTVAIRILFLPMSIKGQRSMMRLQRLQPQVERIRQKFADDKERLNREMVDLYKRNHVNPLGGCAPTALQFPIFIGLYYALAYAVELRHAPFMGWIHDLSAPDCLLIPHIPAIPGTECGGLPVLVILMGISTFLQQYMSPKSPDPNQQRLMMLMPLVFVVMFINFPAGLSLYYFTSNLLGVIQQLFLNREFKQLSPVNA